MLDVNLKDLRSCHELKYLIPISLQPDGQSFDLAEFDIRNTEGLGSPVAKK